MGFKKVAVYLHEPKVCANAPRDDAYELRIPESCNVRRIQCGLAGCVDGRYGVYIVKTEVVNVLVSWYTDMVGILAYR